MNFKLISILTCIFNKTSRKKENDRKYYLTLIISMTIFSSITSPITGFLRSAAQQKSCVNWRRHALNHPLLMNRAISCNTPERMVSPNPIRSNGIFSALATC